MPNEIRLNPVIAIAAVHPTTRPARVSRAQQRWRPSTTSPFIWTSVAVVCAVGDVQPPPAVQRLVSLSPE